VTSAQISYPLNVRSRQSSEAWLFFVIAYLAVLLVVFGGGLHHELFFLIAFLLTLVGAVSLLLLGTDRMLLAVPMLAIAFNGLYAPIFGFFMGLEGEAPFLYKLVLGLRSGLYASLIAWMALVLCYRKESKTPRLKLVYFGMMFLMLGWTGISAGGLEGRAAYLLNSFVPFFMSMIIAVHLSRADSKVDLPAKSVFFFFVVLLSVGLVYFSLLSSNYSTFRPDLVATSHASGGVAYGEYDGSWETSVEGHRLTRMVGTFADPIVIGYLTATLAFISLVLGSPFAASFFVVVMVCTLAKGAWFFFLQAVALYLVGRFSILLRLPMLGFFAAVQVVIAAVSDTSAKVHLQGLVGGLQSMIHAPAARKVLGFGIGDGGNLGSADFASAGWRGSWLGSGAESAIGVIAHQAGALGLFVVACFAWFFIWKSPRTKADLPSYAIACLWMSLLCNCLLQENCFNISVTSSVLMGTVLLACHRVGKKATQPTGL
jgi:hypothetical protein